MLVNMKQKESAKPSRNGLSGKPELRHPQQSFLPQTSLVQSATGSLDLRLVSSAISEQTSSNTLRIRLRLVIVNNDRRTVISIRTPLVFFTLLLLVFEQALVHWRSCKHCRPRSILRRLIYAVYPVKPVQLL